MGLMGVLGVLLCVGLGVCRYWGWGCGVWEDVLCGGVGCVGFGGYRVCVRCGFVWAVCMCVGVCGCVCMWGVWDVGVWGDMWVWGLGGWVCGCGVYGVCACVCVCVSLGWGGYVSVCVGCEVCGCVGCRAVCGGVCGDVRVCRVCVCMCVGM